MSKRKKYKAVIVCPGHEKVYFESVEKANKALLTWQLYYGSLTENDAARLKPLVGGDASKFGTLANTTPKGLALLAGSVEKFCEVTGANFRKLNSAAKAELKRLEVQTETDKKKLAEALKECLDALIASPDASLEKLDKANKVIDTIINGLATLNVKSTLKLSILVKRLYDLAKDGSEKPISQAKRLSTNIKKLEVLRAITSDNLEQAINTDSSYVEELIASADGDLKGLVWLAKKMGNIATKMEVKALC